VKGLAPTGTFIKKNLLACNMKNKRFSYDLRNDKTPEANYAEIKSLLINKLGLISQDERNILINAFTSAGNRIKQGFLKSTFKNLTILQRELAIDRYACSKMHTDNLSVVNARLLVGRLNTNISSGKLNYSDFTMKNGVIVDVRQSGVVGG
jgi:hypothetical protein